MRDFDKLPAKISHPYAWLWEPLENDPTFALKFMFGSRAAYMDGKLQLCFFSKKDPWRGVLVATDRQHHESLIKEFPSLVAHPVLPKWLYLPESADDFESAAQRIVNLVARRDGRIGVESSGEKKKSVGQKSKADRSK